MRILLANKFYYPRGGDCIYALWLEKLLQQAGHEVAFFSQNYPQNLDNPWKKYWTSAFSFKTFMRPFGDKETKSKFTQLLNDFKPAVLHLNNIHTQISPVIAEIAHERGIKVVWTLHDYKLLCPSYSCLNQGKPCEKCFSPSLRTAGEAIQNNKVYCTKNKCLKNSKIQSYIAQKEAEKWNRERLEKCVDAFICPSLFMKTKMEQGGFDKDKLHVLNNFIDMPSSGLPRSARNDDELYYCFVGRLSEEKGIRTLLRVASQLPYKLKVLGTGPLERDLRRGASAYAPDGNIEFLGHCPQETVRQTLTSAKFSVMPSECYENNPLSVIESLCLGTPVLGANIGGIPELIEPGVTGELFDSGNEVQLKKWIEKMMQTEYSFDARKIAERFGAERYLESIQTIYKGGN